jgi:hypothetical protein
VRGEVEAQLLDTQIAADVISVDDAAYALKRERTVKALP